MQEVCTGIYVVKTQSLALNFLLTLHHRNPMSCLPMLRTHTSWRKLLISSCRVPRQLHYVDPKWFGLFTSNATNFMSNRYKELTYLFFTQPHVASCRAFLAEIISGHPPTLPIIYRGTTLLVWQEKYTIYKFLPQRSYVQVSIHTLRSLCYAYIFPRIMRGKRASCFMQSTRCQVLD